MKRAFPRTTLLLVRRYADEIISVNVYLDDGCGESVLVGLPVTAMG
jgi:hypothetical protein